MRFCEFKRAVRLVAFCCSLGCCHYSWGQYTPSIGVSRPPSPQAQSFEVFGRYPVSNYTGLADIGIPIFKHKVDGYDICIDLKYHPSGIKVNQVASWVGLGWNITGVGTITRTINGVADEDPEGILGKKEICPSSLLDKNYCESDILKGLNFAFLGDAATGIRDSESDTYFLNVGDINCRFVIRPDGKCETIPLSNIIIENINGCRWSVKDEHGNTFIFDRTETCYYKVFHEGLQDFNNDITAWYLTKVITARGQEIIYRYQVGGASHIPSRSETLCYYHKVPIGKSGEKLHPDYFQSVSNSERRYVTPILDTVIFPGGKLAFDLNLDTREDVKSMNFSLNKINLYDDKSKIVDEFRFEYGYFESEGFDTPYRKRLKLKRVYNVDPKIDVFKRYDFEYYEDLKLPPVNSCAQDYWGYSNGARSNDSEGNTFRLIPNEVFKGKNTTPLFFGVDRSPKFPEMRAWMLKSITYPSMGRTEFEYAPHDRYIAKDSEADKRVVDYAYYSFDNKDVIQKKNENEGIGFVQKDCDFIVPGIKGWNAQVKFNIKLSPNTGGMNKHNITLVNKTKNTTVFSQQYINAGDTKIEKREEELTSGDCYILKMSSNSYMADEVELIVTYERNIVSSGCVGITEILGGLRISKILNYKNVQDKSPQFTEYRYTDNKVSSGYCRDVKCYNKTFKDSYLPTVNSSSICGKFLDRPIINGMDLFSSNSYNGLGETMGASVGYGRVEVWQGERNVDSHDMYIGGHRVFYYTLPSFDLFINKSPFAGYVAYYNSILNVTTGDTYYDPALVYAKYFGGVFDPPFPMFQPSYKDWEEGIFRKEELYSDKGELIRETVNYNTFGMNSRVVADGIKVGVNNYLMTKMYSQPQDPRIVESSDKIQGNNTNYFFRKYEVISDRVRLDSTVTMDYQGGKMLTRRVRYGYDPIYSLVKKIEEFNPTSSKETFITYPFDYVSPVCDTMTKHRLFYKVESTEKVNGRIVKGEKFDYELGCFNQKLNRQFVNLSAAYRWIPGGWDKLSSIRYSKDGDMEEVNSKGVLNSYLWGKYKYYPAVGATGVGIALLKDQLAKVGYKEGGVDTLIARIGALNTAYQRNLFADFNNKFRSGLGKEVQVETYTYDPLLGLTSATDGRGQTLRYRYDGERRLSEVVNNEGKLVGQYSYRYYNDMRPEVDPLRLSVSTSNLNFGYGVSRMEITVTSNTSWQVSRCESWLHCVRNGDVLIVEVSANSATSSRSGQIILAGNGIANDVIVMVTQSGAPLSPYLTISPSSLKTLQPGVTGLLGTVQVSSNTCWSVSFDQMNRQTPYVKVVNDSGSSVANGCGNMNLKVYQIEPISGDSPSSVIIKTDNGGLQRSISIGKFGLEL